MTSWKVKLGGALQQLGKAVQAIGILPSLTSMKSAENLFWFIAAGYLIDNVGSFFLMFGRDNDTTSEDVAAVKLASMLEKMNSRVQTPADTAEIRKLQARVESVAPPKL